jgi:hypothetical protein
MAGETCYDPVTRRPRVLSEQCATCIFRPGNPMHLNPGRVREMVAGALEQGSQGIICHSTLSYGEHPGFGGALCRGFYDRYGSQSNFIRVIGRLGGFTEVDLPGRERCRFQAGAVPHCGRRQCPGPKIFA